MQTKPNIRNEIQEIEPLRHDWLLVHESLPGAVEAARQKCGQMLGSLATQQVLRIEASEPKAESTLLDTLKRAKHGDASAEKAVAVNVQTNLAEMLYKAGHQTRVALELHDGRLTQNGMQLADIQANTLRYSTLNDVMQARSEQELENLYTFEELIGGGVLDTHHAVVFSLAPDDAQTKRQFGFYEATETCSVQMLTQDNDGGLALETALVAGRRQQHAPRHDKQAIARLAERHGLDIALDDSEASLRQILLLPKTEFAGGIEQVVAAYDAEVGPDSFYGQACAKRPDYDDYARQCAEKNNRFTQAAESITRQLLQQADRLQAPMDALKLMHSLSEQSLVSRAIADEDIDTSVFGSAAARQIISARRHVRAGDKEAAFAARNQAVELANMSSCPMFGGAKDQEGNKLNDPMLAQHGEDQYGSLAFRCPLLGCLNVRKPGQLIEACQHCRADVRC